mmetsp:Transcript_46111/g.55904  ORF Transcript_46111/g.55904 Transcript_46111/m.55904 type:complete len:99 (-) Transcript_46111:63-359(-)
MTNVMAATAENNAPNNGVMMQSKAGTADDDARTNEDAMNDVMMKAKAVRADDVMTDTTNKDIMVNAATTNSAKNNVKNDNTMSNSIMAHAAANKLPMM